MNTDSLVQPSDESAQMGRGSKSPFPKLFSEEVEEQQPSGLFGVETGGVLEAVPFWI